MDKNDGKHWRMAFTAEDLALLKEALLDKSTQLARAGADRHVLGLPLHDLEDLVRQIGALNSMARCCNEGIRCLAGAAKLRVEDAL